ncbi:recombinase family protein [Amycolatopsis sp. WAC 04182]|uniref:recombinase family protein n=1 Tax=Amycolatopsis sp. WAC 04182 TaxID=2203198 RepID=UPI001F1B6386|nr:recombinase family protein [Amycolatopsis sp. WAC 04182]
MSISKLARMLCDRYYLGYVTYRGEELPGRHKPLIGQRLFDRVQAVLDARTTSGERRRTHHHYLKGTLYCGHCHQTSATGRMIIQHTVTRHRDEYTYFFCRNRQQANCPAPYVNVAIAAHAVERYYTTISHQQVADAVARLATGNIADDDLGQTLAPVQIYRICDDDQRR